MMPAKRRKMRRRNLAHNNFFGAVDLRDGIATHLPYGVKSTDDRNSECLVHASSLFSPSSC